MQWHDFLPAVRHLSLRDQGRVQQAFDLCIQAHDGQVRKSGEPYCSHPIAAARILATMGADADTLIAALLHDVLEDTPLALPELEQRFGHTVASLIEGVTKLDREEIRAHPTLDEEIESLRKMMTAMQSDVRLMVIKLADRLHNMQTIAFLPAERQASFARETLDVYVKIADRLSMQDFRDNLEELCLQVLEPSIANNLKRLRSQNERRGEEVIRRMTAELRAAVPPLPPHAELKAEHKTWNHLRTRLAAQEQAISKLPSLTIVFLCERTPECYEILGVLHQKWPHEILSFKDFINAPAVNGYRGLHTTIILPDGTRIRCKIRTREMHAYARKGVTTLCFGHEYTGLPESSPWAQHLASLSRDTAKRSQEFWDSLQSDILGKSILIYGPDDSAVQLPQGATALDGALYLFKETALKTQSIVVNGVDVPFFTMLTNGVSLTVKLSRLPTVSRDWLGWVHSGFATALIRSALGATSTEKRVEVGKALIEDTMLRQSRGYLSEFKEADILQGLRPLGYASLAAAYADVADGHLDPVAAVAAIFRPKRHHGIVTPARQPCVISFMVEATSFSVVERFLPIEQRYHVSLEGIRLTPTTHQRMRALLRCALSTAEQGAIIAELRAAGAQDITVRRTHSRIRHFFSLGLILALWGLDPVLAHLLLTTYDISALDLTIIRFFSLTGMSLLLLLWAYLHLPLRQERLSLKNATLWMSVLALFVVALTTYLSLEETLPTHYTIPMTASGVLLTGFVNRKRWKVLLASSAFLLAGMIFLIAFSPAWSPRSILFTLVAVGAFTLFSVVSEKYKRLEHVETRAAQYFFVLSLLCMLLTLPLLPLSHLSTYPPPALARMILFSIFFAGLPYYIYYYILSHQEIDFVMRYSFLLVFATLVGQLLLMGSIPWTMVLLPAILVTIGAALPLITSSQQHTPS